MRLMKSLVLVASLGITGGFAACGKEKASQSGTNAVAACTAGSGSTVAPAGSGSTSGSASAAALTDCKKAEGAGVGTSSVSGSAGAAVAKAGSLFDFCKWNPNDKGGGCMICTPRELELLKCAKDVKAEFDAAKDCNGNADTNVLSCEMGTNEEFVWDLSQSTRTESIYEKLPLLITGAKILLGEKFKNDPKGDVIMGALDVFAKHAKTIFNNGDVGPVADDLAALAKKAKPAIKDEELQSIKTQMASTINSIQAKRKNGEFADADMVTLIAGFITNLPSDLIGDGLGGLDLNVLTQALAGGSSGDLLSILAGTAGKSSGSGAASASGS